MTTQEHCTMEIRACYIFILFAVSFHHLPTVESRIAEHEILSLPGWSGPLPTRHYSGYLSPISSTTKKLFYWFVESAGDPQSDPLLLWLNGGPGCSSLDCNLAEIGPLLFNGTSLDSPSYYQNPYSFNKYVNILFIETPIGVGFSYSTNETDYIINDNQSAIDNYGFLVSFFQGYPEYRKNDFIAGGESNAGIYIPTLIFVIEEMNKKVAPENVINLKGFVIGSGCAGEKVGSCAYELGLKLHMEFYYGHGLISRKTYQKITLECQDYKNMSNACYDAINHATDRMGRLNIFNVYEPCIKIIPRRHESYGYKNLLEEVYLSSHKPHLYQGPLVCMDNDTYEYYLNEPMVREAIHADPISVTGAWEICHDLPKYTRNLKSLLPFYPHMIKTYHGLIYSGEADALVPWMGNEMWIESLNLPLREEWRSWLVDGQVAGYVTGYDYGFNFVTIKGAGHVAGQDRPKQLFAIFERYIKNLPF